MTSTQTHLVNTAVTIMGSGSCRDPSNCDEFNALTIAYASDLTSNATVPTVSFNYTSATDATENGVWEFAAASVSVDSRTANALRSVGTVLTQGASVNDVAASIVKLEVQFPSASSVMISLGAGLFTISTVRSGSTIGPLAGTNGLCGYYSKTTADEFSDTTGKLVLGGIAGQNYYNSDAINNWSLNFRVNTSAAAIPSAAANQANNEVAFYVKTSINASVEECRQLCATPALRRAPFDDAGFRNCVYDYSVTNTLAVGASNLYATAAISADSSYLIANVPVVVAPQSVEQRTQSANRLNLIATILSIILGTALVLGLLANQRLKKSHEHQLLIARANAVVT